MNLYNSTTTIRWCYDRWGTAATTHYKQWLHQYHSLPAL